MLRKNKIIAVEFALLGFGVLATFLWKGWTTLKVYGYESCLQSVASNLQLAQDFGKLEPKTHFDDLPENGSWKVFTESEANTTLSQIQGTDCSGTTDITLDPWGRKVHVAIRSVKYFPRVLVWSNGADGTAGTSDDVIAPFGEEIPK